MQGAGSAGWAESDGDDSMRWAQGFASASETGNDSGSGEDFGEDEGGTVDRDEAAWMDDTRHAQVDAEVKTEAEAQKNQFPHLDLTLSDSEDDNDKRQSSDSDLEVVEPVARLTAIRVDKHGGQAGGSLPLSPTSHSPRTPGHAVTEGGSPASYPPQRPATPVDSASFPSDCPLPEIPRQFHLLNHAPMRTPGSPAVYEDPRGMRSEDRLVVGLKELERAKRVEEQMKRREEGGEAWDFEWELMEAKELRNKRKGKEKETAESAGGVEEDWHDVAFFPFGDHSGLNFLKGVFAVCGDRQASRVQSSLACRMLMPRLPIFPLQHYREEYFTLAWSVNITTRPYTPMLAVAGRGRVIEIWLVEGKANGSFELHHDRTISGHGGHIFHLAFHPSRPHLLASTSLDRTVRFVDTTLPWGRNDVILYRITRELKGRSDKRHGGEGKRSVEEGDLLSRRKVSGELLAIANEGGHSQGVVSCDFHPTLPLLVSCGMDGYTHVWRLPNTLLSATPSFATAPHQPIFRHPDCRLRLPPGYQPPALPPPIFSSLSVHTGQWPTSVRFASRTSCLILSSAPVLHDDARYHPRKSVKLWVPHILDVGAPNEVLEKRQEELHEASARLSTLSKEETIRPLDGRESALFPPQPPDKGLKAKSSTAFRVQKEMVLEGQDLIGDKLGWYSPRAAAAEQGGLDVPVLVMPTSLPVTKDGAKGDGLYFFRPFSSTRATKSSSHARSTSTSCRMLSRSASNLSHSSYSSTPLGSTASPGTKLSAEVQSLALRSTGFQPPSQAQRIASSTALFPQERNRSMHDFHPRQYPSFVAPVPHLPFPVLASANGLSATTIPGKQEQDHAERVSGNGRATPHYRSVAVQPEGAEVVVAVGESGTISMWRKRRKGEDLS
ncbi:hypothetical protein JCM11251_004029 [Rhodosporidiobolus azoricus]